MILLIDANILLDVLMNRQDFVKDSSMIWKLCETNQAKGYISVLTIANLMYIMRKQLDPETIEKLLVQLKFIFDFTDFGVSDLQRAAEMKWTDFEDAIQSATAERLHAWIANIRLTQLKKPAAKAKFFSIFAFCGWFFFYLSVAIQTPILIPLALHPSTASYDIGIKSFFDPFDTRLLRALHSRNLLISSAQTLPYSPSCCRFR